MSGCVCAGLAQWFVRCMAEIGNYNGTVQIATIAAATTTALAAITTKNYT